MTTVDKKLFLAEPVDNMRQAMLEARAASAAELDNLRTAVAAAARDPGTSSTRPASTRCPAAATAHCEPSAEWSDHVPPRQEGEGQPARSTGSQNVATR